MVSFFIFHFLFFTLWEWICDRILFLPAHYFFLNNFSSDITSKKTCLMFVMWWINRIFFFISHFFWGLDFLTSFCICQLISCLNEFQPLYISNIVSIECYSYFLMSVMWWMMILLTILLLIISLMESYKIISLPLFLFF